MKHVKIKKAWDSLSDQYTEDKDGNKWLVPVLIDKAKDLEPFDIPLIHLCTSGVNIGGMPVREFVSHMKLVLEADLSHPIILDEDAGVFDGRHRIARALLDELEVIKAVRFEEDPPPDVEK